MGWLSKDYVDVTLPAVVLLIFPGKERTDTANLGENGIHTGEIGVCHVVTHFLRPRLDVLLQHRSAVVPVAGRLREMTDRIAVNNYFTVLVHFGLAVFHAGDGRKSHADNCQYVVDNILRTELLPNMEQNVRVAVIQRRTDKLFGCKSKTCA